MSKMLQQEVARAVTLCENAVDILYGMFNVMSCIAMCILRAFHELPYVI